jgi:hypothetical protein
MGRPLKIAKAGTIDYGYSNVYGVVGGDTGLTPATIQCRVKIGSNSEANGYIVKQKGKRKFLVSDGSNTGVCLLSDLANSALTADTMTVTATLADTSTVRLAHFTNTHGTDFSNVRYILTFGAASAAPAGSGYAVATVTSA